MSRCISGDECRDDAMPDGKFCSAHQAILDRVRANMHKPDKKAKPKPVTVTRVEPISQSGRTRQLQADILDALESGPLSAADLHAALGSSRGDRTYGRALADLRNTHRIEAIGQSRATRYRIVS